MMLYKYLKPLIYHICENKLDLKQHLRVPQNIFCGFCQKFAAGPRLPSMGFSTWIVCWHVSLGLFGDWEEEYQESVFYFLGFLIRHDPGVEWYDMVTLEGRSSHTLYIPERPLLRWRRKKGQSLQVEPLSFDPSFSFTFDPSFSFTFEPSFSFTFEPSFSFTFDPSPIFRCLSKGGGGGISIKNHLNQAW